jgi:hypothetical protein
MIPVDTSFEWPKPKSGGGVEYLYAVQLFSLFKSPKYLEQYCLLTISPTEKASLLLLGVPLVCSVKTTLKIKGTLNTATEQRLSYLDRVLRCGILLKKV